LIVEEVVVFVRPERRERESSPKARGRGSLIDVRIDSHTEPPPRLRELTELPTEIASGSMEIETKRWRNVTVADLTEILGFSGTEAKGRYVILAKESAS
jgi:hypothetical protein